MNINMNSLKLCWNILSFKKGNLYEHAVRELSDDAGDEMQQLMNQDILDLVMVFSTQGHSGFSASYAISSLKDLLRFEPLRPLTGNPNEWAVLSDDMSNDDMQAQNKRCSRVFMRVDGTAYDVEGRIFREPSGACFISKDSRVDITFPYTPKTEYVDVLAEE